MGVRIRAIVMCLLAVVAGAIVAVAHHGGGARARAPRTWFAVAEAAYARSHDWWDPRRAWYRQYLPGTGRDGIASMWGIVPLFDAAEALAIAHPSHATVAAARSFADAVERYWNPRLQPVPAYSPTPGRDGPHVRTWYDDEAWWGVAFFDAYRATGDRRYLDAAARSLRFVDSGWDPRGGGIYWDNLRSFKSTESLAGGMLTAADLYATTHHPADLALIRRYLHWADGHIRGRDGLYGNRATPAHPMAYIEGPIAEAEVRVCRATRDRSWCRRGERLLRATVARFPAPDQGPQWDSFYIRSLVQVYRLDHDPRWYDAALAAGRRALAHSAVPHGLYLRLWDGRPTRAVGTPPGRLQVHAATTSVFAWLAAAKPPGGGQLRPGSPSPIA